MPKTKPFKPDPELVCRTAVDFRTGFHMSTPSWRGTTVEAGAMFSTRKYPMLMLIVGWTTKRKGWSLRQAGLGGHCGTALRA